MGTPARVKDGEWTNITKTAAATITAAQSGACFLLGDADGFTLTLPAAAKGLKYKFVVSVAPTTAYIIGTDSADNVFYGSVASPEQAAVVFATAADVINFVASKALVGDAVTVECHDGTNWSVTGFCNVQDGITGVQTA